MLTLLTSSLLWAGWVEGSPWLESHNCTYLQIVSTKMGIILKPPKHIKIARVWFSSPLSFCLFFSPFHVFMLYTLCDNLITLSNGSNLCHRSLLPPQAISYFRFFFLKICFLLLKGAQFCSTTLIKGKSKGTKCWCSEVAESPHHKLGQSRAKPCIWHRQNSPLPWAPALSMLATSQWPFWVSDPYSSGTLFLGAKPVVLTFRSLYRLEAFFSFHS